MGNMGTSTWIPRLVLEKLGITVERRYLFAVPDGKWSPPIPMTFATPDLTRPACRAYARR